MYIDPAPVVSDGLLPGLDELVVQCETTPVARPTRRERASGEASMPQRSKCPQLP
jgi:hypothetical protein